jgi:2,3-bisphosphoglycerate-independent phosphoglycerate mutase
MRVLVLFLDGVGLGTDSLETNPLAAAPMPNLRRLLGGRPLTASSAPYSGELASLQAIDPRLQVAGAPQSATGQAVLLTGRNVPAEIGEHYGPKPNPQVAAILRADNLFMQVHQRGGHAALLNAYPPRYFEGIDSGHRIYSAIPMAAAAAGIQLFNSEDLQAGAALSADFTGEGWAGQPDFPPAPIYTPQQAGALLAALAMQYDLSWFDYWPSDYAGHRADFDGALALLSTLDGVLHGLAQAWQDKQALMVMTSDHGNLEDCTKRGHTLNDVPLLLLGPAEARARFSAAVHGLADIAPAILAEIFNSDGRHD